MNWALELAAALLVAGIVATAVQGAREGDGATVVNGAAMLVVALVPGALAVAPPSPLAARVGATSELFLWTASAGFLHQLGMRGRYESTWWWDHLTHTVSGALLAALLYAALLVVPDGPGPVAVAAATVGGTLALGLVWELVELVARELGERYGVEPVLVHYGWTDTGFDLLFDVVGALVVVGLDLRSFVPLLAPFPDAVDAVLAAGPVAVLVGAAGMAAAIRIS
ncbi:MAG: hypothetical protein V5A23_09005 [Halobacteriales archaeon]